MGKYTNITSDIFSIFDKVAWKAEAIKTVPSDFNPNKPTTEYIRVSIIPGSSGVNLKSCRGLLMIDIFVPAGKGPNLTNLIADKLDLYLQGKSVMTVTNNVTQFLSSNLGSGNPDSVNPTLFRTTYQISFNFYGVN
jgi:Bacteriophage related domain of unknown function